MRDCPKFLRTGPNRFCHIHTTGSRSCSETSRPWAGCAIAWIGHPGNRFRHARPFRCSPRSGFPPYRLVRIACRIRKIALDRLRFAYAIAIRELHDALCPDNTDCGRDRMHAPTAVFHSSECCPPTRFSSADQTRVLSRPPANTRSTESGIEQLRGHEPNTTPTTWAEYECARRPHSSTHRRHGPSRAGSSLAATADFEYRRPRRGVPRGPRPGTDRSHPRPMTALEPDNPEPAGRAASASTGTLRPTVMRRTFPSSVEAQYLAGSPLTSGTSNGWAS